MQQNKNEKMIVNVMIQKGHIISRNVVLSSFGKSVKRYAFSGISTVASRPFSTDERKELEYPRAVSKEEAPFIKPPKETGTESFMPWRGWVERLMKDKLGAERYDSIKGVFHFWPEDPNKLYQQQYPNHKTTYGKGGESISFREVSPGSQPAVDIPRDDLDADPYDSGYFKRDTRRRYVDPEFPHPDVEQLKLDMQNPDDPDVQEAKKQLAAGPESSPGNNNNFATGPSDYDPTGLRSVMAVNNPELFKSLDKHMPDHLPTPAWKKDEAELYQWYKDRDLPVPIGGTFNGVSTYRRVAKW